jgi:hypothetical protein
MRLGARRATPARRFDAHDASCPEMPETPTASDGAAVAASGGMKKPTTQKLALRTQTLRQLTQDALAGVAGGFLMKDTIIIRTSGVVAGPTDLP